MPGNPVIKALLCNSKNAPTRNAKPRHHHKEEREEQQRHRRGGEKKAAPPKSEQCASAHTRSTRTTSGTHAQAQTTRRRRRLGLWGGGLEEDQGSGHGRTANQWLPNSGLAGLRIGLFHGNARCTLHARTHATLQSSYGRVARMQTAQVPRGVSVHGVFKHPRRCRSPRCAGGSPRARGRCLAVVGLQSLLGVRRQSVCLPLCALCPCLLPGLASVFSLCSCFSCILLKKFNNN